MALTNTGALYRLVAGRPGSYYLLMGKVKGRTAYEGVVVRREDIPKWIERWQRSGKPRFFVLKLTPVAKYVKKRGVRADYVVKEYKSGGIFF